ncbi:DUF1517 domain-containing protein [Synechococcus sp. HK01-R]|uniref:DUF1517 domain-containing protein n=1 Tax=Synechococcus sp. HK01-R TaxID=2751171 RepID=UPI001627D3BD|nr:DUF1517 domain-containing protein [Synechococcus sp. HK01-R]QNG27015.1 DUF1517 domain-containing protein [Synechococcus sp. HK01-R]
MAIPRSQPLPNRSLKRLLNRCLSALLVPALLIGLLVIQPQASEAASGGRIGGGSFRAPSMPRSGGYSRSYGGGYNRGYGGGIGFPFIIPIFGFGGGGLFGFLILMAIVGVLVNAFRGAGSGGGGNNALTGERYGGGAISAGPVTMIQMQIGLLASAKALQNDLRQLAASADTSTPSGLQRVLQETTLALLRQPDLWVYANVETGNVPFNAAEATFNRLSMTERSKLRAELTSNVNGQSSTSSEQDRGDADATNDYIAVTVLVASRRPVTLKQVETGEGLREALRILGSTASSDLIALEVIWQPDGAGDVLSADELVTAYPNLQHL